VYRTVRRVSPARCISICRARPGRGVAPNQLAFSIFPRGMRVHRTPARRGWREGRMKNLLTAIGLKRCLSGTRNIRVSRSRRFWSREAFVERRFATQFRVRRGNRRCGGCGRRARSRHESKALPVHPTQILPVLFSYKRRARRHWLVMSAGITTAGAICVVAGGHVNRLGGSKPGHPSSRNTGKTTVYGRDGLCSEGTFDPF
jgi:hypothetical protein